MASVAINNPKTYKVVIVGNGMVGHKFIEYLSDLSKNLENTNIEIFTFTEEPILAYDRVQLSSYFTGMSIEDLSLTDQSSYQSLGVKFHLNDKVNAINRNQKIIITEQGHQIEYDQLILATGSTPFVPPIPGADAEYIHVYRTLADLDAIKTSANSSKTGVVIGGGLLGLEAANALQALNLNTSVIEFSPQLMPVQLDKSAGLLLQRKIEALGVDVLTQKNTTQIIQGKEQRFRLEFSDGEYLETDMIVFSAGIRPQDELARHAELSLGERGGIVINDYCITSDEDIYAIGECALWDNKIFGLVAPGYQMAKVAATHCFNRLTAEDDSINLEQNPATEKRFKGADMSTKLKLLGVDVASIGDAHGNHPDSLSYSFHDEGADIYKKIVVSKDGKKLLGAVLIGDANDYGTWLQLFLNQLDIPQPAERLLLSVSDNTNGTTMAIGIENIPLSAQICSCNDVSKGEIVNCIKQGTHELGILKTECKAGTGCGGCSQLVGQILSSELTKLGIKIDNRLCEHFDYTRAELFDVIHIKKITTFDALIAEYGQGHGCDICKPTAASIFASLWNAHLLDEPHVMLQDTNDAFLANIQKNGTYSVIPRIPAGEITPQKLIAIGKIADEYNLYTKITGAQRIDLLGAQLHQLPMIWEKLIAAGFETGHAYGKALRTVKSCVGDKWCRFGVQDSTSMAILIEQRYRGIRSPHKVKMAVSGCARECAEAQCKDFGIIATEKGWNLYVAGNGGMRPRHADLFATDLDEETLIRYIDRIMIFYIRTADRLQRTSVWMESLEGGLDYLKEVVIEDSLKICSELENQMTSLVDSYQCEWKTTIEDTEKLKRFKHFVNSDLDDPEVIFSTERGQIIPVSEIGA